MKHRFASRVLTLLALLTLLLTVGALAETLPSAEPSAAEEPVGILSRFETTDLDGNPVDQQIFADYALTMINVWATYCGPCLSEMPELGELAKTYEPRGVRIVGLVSDVINADWSLSESQMETARQTILKTGADYLHIVPSVSLYGLLVQITSVPTTFFVGADGAQVGSTYLGARSQAQWTAIIEETLAQTMP